MITSDQHTDGLAGRILGRIESEHLIPRPRWEFTLRNYFFWVSGALAVVLGALAFSATLFEITAIDWRFSTATHSSFFVFFLAAVPFLWIAALTLFILIGYVNIRRTKHGYRYSLAILALGAVLTSLSLGSGLYAIGLGGAIDEVIGDHPPFYRPIMAAERSWWLAPERGLLVGYVVTPVSGTISFFFRDFSGQLWEIDGSDLRSPDLAAIARGGAVRIVGLPVQAGLPAQTGISVSTTSSAFHACFAFPWETQGSSFGAPFPPPFVETALATGERNVTAARSDSCKNIRPYQQLYRIEVEREQPEGTGE